MRLFYSMGALSSHGAKPSHVLCVNVILAVTFLITVRLFPGEVKGSFGLHFQGFQVHHFKEGVVAEVAQSLFAASLLAGPRNRKCPKVS